MAQPKQLNRHGKRSEETRDFFTRVSKKTAEHFDAIVDSQTPKTSRSSMIAFLIERYVDANKLGKSQ